MIVSSISIESSPSLGMPSYCRTHQWEDACLSGSPRLVFAPDVLDSSCGTGTGLENRDRDVERPGEYARDTSGVHCTQRKVFLDMQKTAPYKGWHINLRCGMVS